MLIYAAYISLCLPHLSIKIFASHTQDQTAIHVDDLCDEISLNFKSEMYSYSTILRTHIIIFPRQYDTKKNLENKSQEIS